MPARGFARLLRFFLWDQKRLSKCFFLFINFLYKILDTQNSMKGAESGAFVPTPLPCRRRCVLILLYDRVQRQYFIWRVGGINYGQITLVFGMLFDHGINVAFPPPTERVFFYLNRSILDNDVRDNNIQYLHEIKTQMTIDYCACSCIFRHDLRWNMPIHVIIFFYEFAFHQFDILRSTILIPTFIHNPIPKCVRHFLHFIDDPDYPVLFSFKMVCIYL